MELSVSWDNICLISHLCNTLSCIRVTMTINCKALHLRKLPLHNFRSLCPHEKATSCAFFQLLLGLNVWWSMILLKSFNTKWPGFRDTQNSLVTWANEIRFKFKLTFILILWKNIFFLIFFNYPLACINFILNFFNGLLMMIHSHFKTNCLQNFSNL